jgi:hypothetical protein
MTIGFWYASTGMTVALMTGEFLPTLLHTCAACSA